MLHVPLRMSHRRDDPASSMLARIEGYLAVQDGPQHGADIARGIGIPHNTYGYEQVFATLRYMARQHRVVRCARGIYASPTLTPHKAPSLRVLRRQLHQCTECGGAVTHKQCSCERCRESRRKQTWARTQAKRRALATVASVALGMALVLVQEGA